MTSLNKKEFVAYVRERFSALLVRHGYSALSRGDSFERRQPPVICGVAFVLSRDRRTFTPRLGVTLPGQEGTGMVAHRDLPAFKEPGDSSKWWRWSLREEASEEIASLLERQGLPWLQQLGNIHNLIEHLESSKRFPIAPGEVFAGAVSDLERHGIRPLHAGSIGAPRPSGPQLRPDVVKHLSHAYEASGDLARALSTWKEYMSLFKPAAGSGFEAELESRLRMLEDRLAGP